MLHRYSLTTECTAPPGMVGRCVAPTEIANPFGICDSSVWIVKGGGSPPFTLCPRSRWQRTEFAAIVSSGWGFAVFLAVREDIP